MCGCPGGGGAVCMYMCGSAFMLDWMGHLRERRVRRSTHCGSGIQKRSSWIGLLARTVGARCVGVIAEI